MVKEVTASLERMSKKNHENTIYKGKGGFLCLGFLCFH